VLASRRLPRSLHDDDRACGPRHPAPLGGQLRHDVGKRCVRLTGGSGGIARVRLSASNRCS
jgi:hypothetical protein